MYTKIAKASTYATGFFSNKNVQLVLGILAVLTGVTIVLPWFVRRAQDQQVNNTINDAQNKQAVNNAENYIGDPSVRNAKEQAILTKYKAMFKDENQKQRLLADARTLPALFGVDKLNYGVIPFFNWKYEFAIDPGSWTEDDAAIGALLRKWGAFFPVLEELYFNVYTESRSLTEDILDDLNTSELVKTKSEWMKNLKKSWL